VRGDRGVLIVVGVAVALVLIGLAAVLPSVIAGSG
jgi:hypothetical protein